MAYPRKWLINHHAKTHITLCLQLFNTEFTAPLQKKGFPQFLLTLQSCRLGYVTAFKLKQKEI